jgi:simple sugar transport system substrate-binding protein
MTSIINNWGPYYVERVKLAMDGKWTTSDTWGGLKTQTVMMAPYTNLPDDVRQMAMATEAAIKAGALHPFRCPVTAQDGKAAECKGGANLDDGQILSMNWYVKGVDDKVPGK